ncbi:MAG: major capsid protein, partial [Gemmobacter sp.]
ASDPISLVQDALEGVVPIEHQQEAMAVPGIDLGQGAVNMVLDVIDLGHEYEAAQLARTLGNYPTSNRVTLTGADRWTSATSDPLADIDAGKEAIRRLIGRYPNTLTLGPSVFNALKRHPKIREQFKYTSAQSITTEMLAAYFDVRRVIVGKAVWLPETAAETAAASDVWGDDAILAYVPEAGNNFQVPSFGYTYELTGYPQVEVPYFERSNDSWIYPTKAERRTYLTGAEGGFLFQNAGLAA